jgi:DNA polymerase I-like protein with 3'-5' exonuclease and polymerase domains
VKINGDILDSMLAWHVLNSAMPKGLGFITPALAQDMPMWKHLSKVDPAGYNCQDSDATLRDFIAIEQALKENDLWNVFDRHVVQVDRVFKYMSAQGVLRDEVKRQEAEDLLTRLLSKIEFLMEEVVPMEARKIDIVYKNEPKNKTGLLSHSSIRMVGVCSGCGAKKPRKDHFKSFVRKINPCAGERILQVEEPFEEYYRLRDWKLSLDQLKRYQEVRGHSNILVRDKDTQQMKVTFDENAITRLIKKYPSDKLYPLILEYREYQKLLGTYVGVTEEGMVKGGMPVGKDGRIHTLFTHNPSTLRSASQQPNLQNLPRPTGNPDDLANLIRNLIVAGPGCVFTARDFSGIEAVLVGYFALSARYIRLAKIDVHSFYTAYALHELDGRVSANDLPDHTWPDDRLIPHLAALKKEFKHERNQLYKHLVHGGNFMQGAKGATEKIYSETKVEHPVSKVKKVMDVYFELFPEIRAWHKSVLAQADRDGFLRNPFGYVLRFNHIYEWEKIGGEWQKKPGAQANEAIAFLPQSTAAGIIKEAMLRLYYERFEEAGQFLRLLVHDELFFETLKSEADRVDGVAKVEMEKPIPELALPASWGMGPYLSIDTEGKMGERWGLMK